MYVATVLLRRSEKQFWRMTPRKLNALANVHVEVNGGGDDKPDSKKKPSNHGYIDQVM